MELVGRQLLWALRSPALVVFLGLAPLASVLWVFQRRRIRHRAQTSESFAEFTLRPAGESLRLRIDALVTRMEGYFLQLLAGSVGAILLILLAPRQLQAPSLAAAAAYLIFCYARFAPRLLSASRALFDHRLAHEGERLVGEELGRLRASGYSVYHDLPLEGSNLDHILVGPAGVFAITTKTRRKPSNLQGGAPARVISDGSSLYFAIGTETRWIPHAKKSAEQLRNLLVQALEGPVDVVPILTLPGWTVERRAGGEVHVLDPLEIKNSLEPMAGAVPLSSVQLARIEQELTGRCRWRKDVSRRRATDHRGTPHEPRAVTPQE